MRTRDSFARGVCHGYGGLKDFDEDADCFINAHDRFRWREIDFVVRVRLHICDTRFTGIVSKT